MLGINKSLVGARFVDTQEIVHFKDASSFLDAREIDSRPYELLYGFTIKHEMICYISSGMDKYIPLTQVELSKLVMDYEGEITRLSAAMSGLSKDCADASKYLSNIVSFKESDYLVKTGII